MVVDDQVGQEECARLPRLGLASTKPATSLPPRPTPSPPPSLTANTFHSPPGQDKGEKKDILWEARGSLEVKRVGTGGASGPGRT